MTEQATRLLRPLVVAVMGLSLAACASRSLQDYGVVSAIPGDYTENHPIAIEETVATFDIPVGQEVVFLPRGMEQNIMGFATTFLHSGSGAIAIVLPTGSRNAINAANIARQVEGVLVSVGVPLNAIEYRSYPVGTNQDQAPLRLAFVRLAATTQPCGPWTDNLAVNTANTNYNNFGCATQQNLAAMIANPLDLLYPRMMTGPNAVRRSGVFQNYQAGQATGTAYPALGGTVTGVGQ